MGYSGKITIFILRKLQLVALDNCASFLVVDRMDKLIQFGFSICVAGLLILCSILLHF